MVKKLVDDCLTTQPSNSLRPHDAVSALGPMYEGHDKNYLPKMQACEVAISNLLMFCKDKKSEMINFVHGYMQKIAYIQYTIRDVRYKFSVFNEAINRQNDQFEHLKVVRGIGPSYRACLAEIVRRRASMKLYMGMAGQLAEKLASKREAEVRKREEFIKVHSLYIPQDILTLMGLYDTPSICDVNLAPFDSNLLDLDIPDLDRFAPERYNESEDIVDIGEIVGTNKMEVENAKLKAELASVTARLCFSPLEIEFESLDEGKMDILLKEGAERTNEALRLKDEYVKQLESVLKDKQMQCGSYEKRIEELEQRLSDRYSSERKINKDDSFTTGKIGDSKSEMSSEVQGHNGQFTEPMDDASYGYSSLVSKSGVDKSSKILDDNMSDSSGMVNPNLNLDSSMREPNRDVNEKDGNEETVPDVGMPLVTSSTADNMLQLSKTCDDGLEDGKPSGDLVVELRNALEEKCNQVTELEVKLEAAKAEVAKLARDLEISRDLLDKSQVIWYNVDVNPSIVSFF
ncbi:hypothetical protein M8C21_028859 [Ambrosia artemisiifolia]|uniref:Autophagy protein ATG17-like domain-containing protein n=1 Tax=Ambrosia artemisiifolia TaxID=4212 RepID=A0AAD5CJ04_AMBAR|nr:hypothetical protein M8C21_028859 [Ambrosia artemisiifolia]